MYAKSGRGYRIHINSVHFSTLEELVYCRMTKLLLVTMWGKFGRGAAEFIFGTTTTNSKYDSASIHQGMTLCHNSTVPPTGKKQSSKARWHHWHLLAVGTHAGTATDFLSHSLIHSHLSSADGRSSPGVLANSRKLPSAQRTKRRDLFSLFGPLWCLVVGEELLLSLIFPSKLS
jgi:hypothetical protein